MKKEKNLLEDLEKKYLKADNVSDLRDLLYRSANKYKNDAAFRLKDDKGKIYSVTYEEFKNDVVAFGTALLDLGLLGKPIGVVGKNSYKWAVSYLASTIIGVVVPIDKELHSTDIVNFLNSAEADCLIGDYKNVSDILSIKNDLNNKDTKFIVMDENLEGTSFFDDVKKDGVKALSSGNNSFSEIKIDPDEMKILLFTSGTTANSKGVCLSQRNIVSNILSTAGIVDVTNKDQVLSILPIHHTYECTLGYLFVIYSGACISYCEGLKYINKNMTEFKPTIILCVPLLLEKIYKKLTKILDKVIPKKYYENGNLDFDKLPGIIKQAIKVTVKKTLGGKLHTFIVGAAAINPNIVEAFFELGITTLQGYGLTECSPLVAGNNIFYHKYDAVGLPIPNVKYDIDNPDSNGIGEIIVKGPNVMLGYYKDEEATNNVLKNGWFHTGDLGRIDDDGFLYITGRCKTVIVTKNGKNIYPEEIEYYLNESPMIIEAIVMGVDLENSDDIYVHAQIYPDIEVISKSLQIKKPTDEDIKQVVSEIVQNINSTLPNYKHIKKFTIRDSEFEKTTTRKIKRYGDNMKI